MNKRFDPFLTYAYLDSQRLKDTFFAPQKKKTPSKEIILITLIATTILTIIFFILEYELIVIPRKNTTFKKNSISLLHSDTVASVTFLEKNNQPRKTRNMPIYITMPLRDETGIRINLAKPINLADHYLFLYLKRQDTPLSMKIVLRDTRFYSNSLQPVQIDAANNHTQSYAEIPVRIKKGHLQNVNLSKINQIHLYFYPHDNRKMNWLFIKDIIIVKKLGGLKHPMIETSK